VRPTLSPLGIKPGAPRPALHHLPNPRQRLWAMDRSARVTACRRKLDGLFEIRHAGPGRSLLPVLREHLAASHEVTPA